MRHFFVLIGAVLYCASFAGAQWREDVSSFAAVRSSQANAKNLFAYPRPLEGVSLGPGDWIEVDLNRDESGRAPFVVSLLCRCDAQIGIDLALSSTPGGPYVLDRTFVFFPNTSSDPQLLQTPRHATSVRLEVRSGGGVASRVQVIAQEFARYASITSHSWYVGAPVANAPASGSLYIGAEDGDSLGFLFAAGGPALLAQPIRWPSASIGGLLLDPAYAHLVVAAPLVARRWWNVGFSFPFDPVLLSTPVHFQGLIVHDDSLLGPVLVWTRVMSFL